MQIIWCVRVEMELQSESFALLQMKDITTRKFKLLVYWLIVLLLGSTGARWTNDIARNLKIDLTVTIPSCSKCKGNSVHEASTFGVAQYLANISKVRHLLFVESHQQVKYDEIGQVRWGCCQTPAFPSTCRLATGKDFLYCFQQLFRRKPRILPRAERQPPASKMTHPKIKPSVNHSRFALIYPSTI